MKYSAVPKNVGYGISTFRYTHIVQYKEILDERLDVWPVHDANLKKKIIYVYILGNGFNKYIYLFITYKL
jgi:hypothetical protein